MALNFRKFIEGLRIVPKASSSASEQGDLDVTSSTGKLNYHNGSSASPIVTEVHAAQGANRLKSKDLEDSSTAIVDATDTSKKILFDAGGTTSTTTTITAAQTANRVITLPNATDTLVGLATSDVLTNKTLTSPVLNTPTADTITGIAGGSLTVQSASNQSLVLQSQGTGNVSIQSSGSTGVTIEDVIVNSNTITGGAAALTVQSASNQNLTLQSQGTGNVSIQSSGSTGVTIEDVVINSNTITGGAAQLSIAAAASQNLSLAAASGSIVLANKSAFSRAAGSFTSVTLNAPTTTYVDITSAPATTLDMINATGVADGQVLILTNRSGSAFTVSNLTGATAANQIVTGTGINISFVNNASLIFIYNSGSSKWYLVGGSGGGGSRAITTITSSTATLANTDSVALLNAASNNITVTLPAPSAGKEFTLKRIDNSSNVVTIATTSGTIDDQTTYLLEYQYDSITLVSDGTNFFIE